MNGVFYELSSNVMGGRTECPSSVSKLVLLMLANYANDRHQTYPSYKKLAELCACNERTVMRAINPAQRA